jgi:3-hydroxyacyl-[acyl-carrier-protein] dehydratase
VDEILALIPHRPPFLFVDAIAARGERWIETTWLARADLELFRGHYPGEPLLPGVLICEHAIQSGALLLALEGAAAKAAGVPVLTRIGDARFRRAVRPGESLSTRVEREESAGNARRLVAQVRVGQAKVARIEFTVAQTALAGAER